MPVPVGRVPDLNYVECPVPVLLSVHVFLYNIILLFYFEYFILPCFFLSRSCARVNMHNYSYYVYTVYIIEQLFRNGILI